jgi:hypothetical protein
MDQSNISKIDPNEISWDTQPQTGVEDVIWDKAPEQKTGSTFVGTAIKQMGKNIQSPFSNFAKATSLPTAVKKLAEWLDLPFKSMTGAGIAAGMSLGSAIESAKKGETGTAILEAGLGVGEAGLGMLNVVPGAAPVMQAFNVGGKALEEVSPKGSEVVNYALTPFKSSLDLEVKKGYKPKSWETPAAGLADVAYQFMLFGLFRKKNYTKPQAEAKAKAIASKIAQKKTLSNEERKIVSEFIPKEKADIQAKIDEIQKRLTERPETQPPQPIPEIAGAPEQSKIPILPEPKAPLESVLLDAQGRPIPTERAKLAEQAQAPLTEAERQTIPVDLESIVPTAKTEITAAPIEAPLKVTPKADIIENIRTAMESGEPVKVEPKKAVETPKAEEVTADALANKIAKEPKPTFTDEELQFYTNNPEAVESALTRLRGEKPQTPVQAEKVSPEASEGAKPPIPKPLPDFTNTESALEFGKANPDRIPELTQRREKNLAESEKLIEKNDLDSAMKSAFKAQLDREAIEAAQKLTQKAPIDLATKGKAIPEQVQKPAEAPKETLTGIKEPSSQKPPVQETRTKPKGEQGTKLFSIASLAISAMPNEVLPFDEETNKRIKLLAGLAGFAGALAMVRGLSPKGMEFFKDVEASAKRSGGGINKWLRSALKSEEAKTLDLADRTKLESVLKGGKLNDIERKVEKIEVKSEEQTPTTETGKEIKPAVKESIPPPTVEVDPELTQIRELVASKKGIVRHQRALYKAERGRRAGMLADVYTEPNGSQTYFKALSRLKGELPKADWGTATDAQLVLREYMHDVVSKSKQSVYDKVDLGRSIEKIFDGESLGKKGYKKLEDFFGKDVVEGLVKQDKWDIVVDLLNVPRTLMSSFDMSMPFRQAAIQTVSHPIKAAKAMKDMHIAAFSEKASKRMYDAIKSRTNNGLYEEFKLDILNFEDPFSRLTNREEAFISKTAQKIKFLGAGVRMAGRAAYTYLNRIRADVFDSYANELKKSGVTPENNPETYKALASWVNISTGRGSYGRFNQFAPTASAVLFSPRLLASRFEILNPHAYYTMYKTSPLLAKKAISDAVKFFGATVGLLALAKQSGVADVEFDPRSADFLKMRIGETRIDPLAGFSQIMRFISREVTGQTKTAKGEIVTGEKFPYPTRADIAGRFAESKLNPHIGLLWSWMKGKGYLGEKFDIEQEALNRILPLYLQDVKDAVNEHGLAGGLSITAPGFYGVGVQVYTPRPAKTSTTKTKYGGKYESNKKSPKYSGSY